MHAQLKEENAKITMQINVCTEQYLKVEGGNTVLRNPSERLRPLDSVLEFIKEVSGMDMDVAEIPGRPAA